MAVQNKKDLIIVESPTKAKTISKIVGDKYTVMSSQGHVCDLPKKGLGIDIKNDFKPEYIIEKDKTKLISLLKNAVNNANFIYLASDDDREGEAISWHLKNVLATDDQKTKRIVFHEITDKAIKNAILNPRDININLVNSQQARRILDRLVGYKISPILWKKIQKGLSAGRVQSVAVKLIVEKEREIKNFKNTTFYKINCIFLYKNIEFKSELKKEPKTQKEVIKIFENIKNTSFTVKNIEKKEVIKEPLAPFTTSTLQQEANNKLGYNVSYTMQLAQKLYEGGKITYMRTDSTLLSDEAMNQAKSVILNEYGDKYLKNRQFKTKAKLAQEAHEAIRPTNMSDKVVSEDAHEQKLYTLIRNRCLASQMADAIIDRTKIIINADCKEKYEFTTTGETIKFDGYLKIYQSKQDDSEEENGFLPDLKKNDTVDLKIIVGKEKTTHGPSRYTEASLVKELEEKGIGRPSTYAPIITVIQNRGYVIKTTKAGEKKEINVITMQDNKIEEKKETKTENSEKDKLYPTDIAFITNDFLIESFKDITSYDFTANIEKELDNISEGKTNWIDVLHKFYNGFQIDLDKCDNSNKIEFEKKLIGVDQKTKKNIYGRLSKYGQIIQLGDNEDQGEKPIYANLLKHQNIYDLTLNDALNLLSLPKLVGEYNGEQIFIHNGPYGPYLKCGKTNAPIFNRKNIFELTESDAIEIIKDKLNYIAKKKS